MESNLEPRLVVKGEKGVPYVHGEFVVASYQRGYRWTRDEVWQLLTDIKESVINASTKRTYYLQPVVVLRRSEDVWELVDGQQRLTTLYLVLKHIASVIAGAEVAYSLTYETREGSRGYLETLDPARRDENADFHHIAAAFEAIEEWFRDQGNAVKAALDVYSALTEWVKVIWYEAPPDTNPNELFARLNRDRIPLTDAELIKALVLSQNGAGRGQRGRREEIAAQWDVYERSLRDEQFWAFLTGSAERHPTHIDFLFECLTKTRRDTSTASYSTFFAAKKVIDERSAASFWRDVIALHGLLTGWFHDRVLYHRVGYLVAIGVSIRSLIEYSKDMTHSQFGERLKELVRTELDVTVDELSTLRYGNQDEKISEVLLLMNVETLLASEDAASRFSFSAFARDFAHGRSSLEHIHAQSTEDLRTEKHWRAWIDDHERRIAIRAWESELRPVAERIAAQLRAYRESPRLNKDDPDLQHLAAEVIRLFSESDLSSDDEMHGLANLALLQRDINSALNNAVFDVKRERILKLDAGGAFILPCTRNVFLKYYTSGGDQNLHLWTTEDRDNYFTSMVSLVETYLRPHEEAPA